jgi:hypothetical protein
LPISCLSMQRIAAAGRIPRRGGEITRQAMRRHTGTIATWSGLQPEWAAAFLIGRPSGRKAAKSH